jgi:hypothetical protein
VCEAAYVGATNGNGAGRPNGAAGLGVSPGLNAANQRPLRSEGDRSAASPRIDAMCQ